MELGQTLAFHVSFTGLLVGTACRGSPVGTLDVPGSKEY